MAICSALTVSGIFSCLMKFVRQNPNIRSKVIPIFEQYLESWEPELQQRAIEYMILCKLDGEDPNIPNITEIR